MPRDAERVSVLFNEPKLLKSIFAASTKEMRRSFSALQRAEIAEMRKSPEKGKNGGRRFSALQRAEIAEIVCRPRLLYSSRVSVLFNEPKLLKSILVLDRLVGEVSFQCSSTSRNC